MQPIDGDAVQWIEQSPSNNGRVPSLKILVPLLTKVVSIKTSSLADIQQLMLIDCNQSGADIQQGTVYVRSSPNAVSPASPELRPDHFTGGMLFNGIKSLGHNFGIACSQIAGKSSESFAILVCEVL